MPEATVAVARDIRVDQIGFVDELDKLFATPLRKTVKARMLDDKSETVAADYFSGLLIAGGLTSKIDPAQWLKLYEKKKINKAQFLSALSVQNKPAAEVLSGEQIYAISTRSKTEPSLRISRLKEVPLQLIDAVKALGAVIAAAS